MSEMSNMTWSNRQTRIKREYIVTNTITTFYFNMGHPVVLYVYNQVVGTIKQNYYINYFVDKNMAITHFSLIPIMKLQGCSNNYIHRKTHYSMWNKKPTRCHLVLYLFHLYKLLNIFRATLCPSSVADDLVVFLPRVV